MMHFAFKGVHTSSILHDLVFFFHVGVEEKYLFGEESRDMDWLFKSRGSSMQQYRTTFFLAGILTARSIKL